MTLREIQEALVMELLRDVYQLSPYFFKQAIATTGPTITTTIRVLA